MYLKAGGNVGIGTTSPSCKLDVRGVANITNTSPYACPNNHMQAGSLTIGDILLNYGGGFQWNANTSGLLMECLDSTEFAVHDAASRIASFMYYSGNRFTVGRDMGYGPIASTNFLGTVTIPGQPAFSAYRNAGDVPGNTVFVCNIVQTNVGSCYNLSNGRFTAPVAGTYLFAFHCMATSSTATYVNIAIRKNGAIISYGHGATSAYDHTNAQVITTMAVNDYIDILVENGYNTVYGGNLHNNFNGHLIG
jgi:hypothetical protein